ncbi:unnamed protein product [Enterobius vermicularis]|uniref:MFS_1_like domain-containing protein n=1 Tax=Enterobius vermicularis TaxID=51028 RepID=A0A158Q9Z4_ENTVE|nr:unnamed protein product [Enterobius vermicularis]
MDDKVHLISNGLVAVLAGLTFGTFLDRSQIRLIGVSVETVFLFGIIGIGFGIPISYLQKHIKPYYVIVIGCLGGTITLLLLWTATETNEWYNFRTSPTVEQPVRVVGEARRFTLPAYEYPGSDTESIAESEVGFTEPMLRTPLLPATSRFKRVFADLRAAIPHLVTFAVATAVNMPVSRTPAPADDFSYSTAGIVHGAFWTMMPQMLFELHGYKRITLLWSLSILSFALIACFRDFGLLIFMTEHSSFPICSPENCSKMMSGFQLATNLCAFAATLWLHSRTRST